MNKEEAKARLRSVGLRATEPRIAILRYLDGNCTHPTVLQIHTAIKEELPKVPEISVYRTLDALTRTGVLAGVHGSSKGWRLDPDTSPHAHAICRECGEVWDVPKKVRAVLGPTPDGFLATYTTVTLMGTCRHCREASDSP